MLGGLAEDAVVDRYTVERTLGEGGFGIVYAARDSQSGQLVALKQLSRLSPSALSQFKQEFRAVQGLNHPNIVRLDGLFEHQSGWMIAMELIEGRDLLSHLRRSDNDPSFDEPALRHAFRQLAEALSGLHEHGILHRDLKPANVRVAHDGRVVLLDFGLVTGVRIEAQSTHLGAAGTAAYMAPEQATGAAMLSAAADWYAFGVCLYEALTGTLPFEADSAMAIMFAKQGKLPDKPSVRLGTQLPDDLEALCMRLLAPNPTERPTSSEVRSAFAVSLSASQSPTSGEEDVDAIEQFEGREAELASISASHARARTQGLRMLMIEGESGMGKSALVAEWLKQLKQREPGALILKSQCYENEHSAFKAFDAGMEALGRRLRSREGKNGELLLPPHAGLLPTLFPSLASVKALKRAPLDDLPADPHSALRCGLIALATLLKALAASDPVVLVIDDLQWADQDSFRLLRILSEAANAPRVLVLATVRPEVELETEVAAELTLLGTRLDLERLLLTGLSKASCEKLASSLLTGSVLAGWLDRITSESKGHPLFVSVLSRYAVSQRPSLSEELSLDAALGQKLGGLPAASRGLLEVLAVAGVPCSVALLSRTLDLGAEQVQKRAAELVGAKLLRRLPHQHLACFHDRVRGIVLSRLDDKHRAPLHQALANAIAAVPGYDPALLALHLEGAGRARQALAAHHQAGDTALAALTFGKAAHHFGRALALAPAVGAEPSQVTALRIQRGHALARAGRSAEAAQQYLDACEHADETQRIALRVWAAQHLLQSAQVEAGLKAAREVLAELGVPLPKGQGAAIARILWDRMCLALRGLELPKNTPEVSATEHAKLEAMWNLTFPVVFVEMMAGATLSTRHLRSSLSAGNRTHAARSLVGEATLITIQEPDVRERANTLFERARTLYAAEEEPALEAWVLYNEGTVATVRNEFVLAPHKLQQAEALLRARCPEEPWLLTNVRSSLASSWFSTGQLGDQVATIERWLAEAAEREDHFALASLETIGQSALRFLLRDEPQRVLETITSVLSPWSREQFALVHLGELIVAHFEAMYRGGDAAWQALEAERARHERAFLLKTTFGKVVVQAFRAQAAFGAYFAAGTDPGKARYLDAAKAAARGLSRTSAPLARFQSPIIETQLAILEGDTERALALTRVAACEASKWGLGLTELSLSYLEGLLEDGDGGREKRERALASALARGWQNPRRFVAMSCPVIDYLESRSR